MTMPLSAWEHIADGLMTKSGIETITNGGQDDLEDTFILCSLIHGSEYNSGYLLVFQREE